MTSPLAAGLRAHLAESDLARLGSVRVGIAGAGGLGSNVAALLVRSGVRRLLIADGDTVEPSNLNRQHYWPEDLGRPKVLALRDRLLGLEPALDLETRQEWLTPASAPDLFRHCSIVVEALDGAALKADLCSSLLSAGFYVIAASGLGGYGLPPMTVRRLGENFVCVGDFTTAADRSAPPLAPRVAQAAALQADAVLEKILGKGGPEAFFQKNSSGDRHVPSFS